MDIYGRHTLALSDQGNVYVWGSNDNGTTFTLFFNILGQLGINNAVSYSEHPIALTIDSGVKISKIAAGDQFSVALRDDGQMIYTWGVYWARGDGTTDSSHAFAPVKVNMTGVLAGKTITSIAASRLAVLVLTQDGKVFSWGAGANHQLGTGDTNDRYVPVQLAPSSLDSFVVSQIAIGEEMAYAITSDHNVFVWGTNNFNTGLVAGKNHPTPVAATDVGMVDGNIAAIIPQGRVVTIISTTKKPYAIGMNQNGNLGIGIVQEGRSMLAPIVTSSFDNTTEIAMCSENGGVAFTRSGTVYTWGTINEGSLGWDPSIVAIPRSPIVSGALAGKDVIAVSMGGVSIALTSDGKLFSWGSDTNGCLGTGSIVAQTSVPVAVDTSGALAGVFVTAVATSSITVSALSDTGAVYMWGNNNQGQAGTGTADDSPNFSPVAVLTDATSALYQKFVVAVAVTSYNCFAVTNEGRVYAWGSTNDGMLGNNTITGGVQKVPAYVYMDDALINEFVVKISAKERSVIVLTSSGNIFVWGNNDNGVLGIGSNAVNQDLPAAVNTTDVLNAKVITDACAGVFNMAAVDTAGNVYAWGAGGAYANGNGDTSNQNSPVRVNMTGFEGYTPISVACGRDHTIAVAKKGDKKALFAWGSALKSELGVSSSYIYPTRLPNIFEAANISVSMSATYHTLILSLNLPSSPTTSPTHTPVPTTTVAPTTTMAPTTSTTSAPTTTTVAPTTTIEPTTSLSPTTTTVAPTTTTTVEPKTTIVPTTMPVPSTTALPTTATPAPTNPPVIQIVKGTATSQVVGNITLVPPPVVNTSLVLFASTNVTVTLPITFARNATIPKEAIVSKVSVSFNVTYLAATAQLAVILSDEDGNQAGNVTVTVDQAGAISVNMKDILDELIRVYQIPFTIRAIRGSVLKVSVGVVTENVAINIDPDITSTIEFSTAVTPAPTTTATPSTTSKPVVIEPQTLSAGAIAGIVVGSVVGVALIVLIVAVIIIIVVVAVIMVRKKKVYVKEKAMFQLDMDIQI